MQAIQIEHEPECCIALAIGCSLTGHAPVMAHGGRKQERGCADCGSNRLPLSFLPPSPTRSTVHASFHCSSRCLKRVMNSLKLRNPSVPHPQGALCCNSVSGSCLPSPWNFSLLDILNLTLVPSIHLFFQFNPDSVLPVPSRHLARPPASSKFHLVCFPGPASISDDDITPARVRLSIPLG